jgi:hypothetical protein
MGALWNDNDYLIATQFDFVNLRFAPAGVTQIEREGYSFSSDQDGIVEMRDLQSRFGIFANGRALKDSFAILGLGGSNPTTKAIFFHYLDSKHFLRGYASDDSRYANGHDRIVGAMVETLALKETRPIYFAIHDTSGRRATVHVSTGQPLPYMREEYCVISVPMSPR